MVKQPEGSDRRASDQSTALGSNGLRLRPATPRDAPRVAVIWHQGWLDGHLGHVPDELAEVRSRESFESRAWQRIDDTVVAEIGDLVGGFVMVVDDEVEQVYVSQEFRGTGVASALLSEAERLVGQGGYLEAWLAVVSGNTRARRFYHRHGWADAGLFWYPAATADGPIVIQAHRYTKPVTYSRSH